MLLGFQTELKVNKTQKILLAKHPGVARYTWKWALRLTKDILDNNQQHYSLGVLPQGECNSP
ncbi:MAG: helix-turn-helix domain-containing protein [Cyanobacteria bacterium P01_A01_bin.84]